VSKTISTLVEFGDTEELAQEPESYRVVQCLAGYATWSKRLLCFANATVAPVSDALQLFEQAAFALPSELPAKIKSMKTTDAAENAS